jgi:hypothetical protein
VAVAAAVDDITAAAVAAADVAVKAPAEVETAAVAAAVVAMIGGKVSGDDLRNGCGFAR